MDLLTQLDGDIDLLLKIMSSSVAFISRKASHTPLPSSTIPLSVLGKTEAITPAEMDEAIAELVSDLIEKADSIRSIIRHLPTAQDLATDTQLQTQLDQIQSEMAHANHEYQEAVHMAKELKQEVEGLLEVVADTHSASRAWLVHELEHTHTV
ncbi:uncharacterized protein PSANT_01678 [Moesziomyces antarcticus]|uniref:Mediator of RNA polymerase II transcription subunit 21 n=2 Tax=Pseudozyma antarctica TaxID=84753 RepID=A0A5C3FHZ1_PSEA2|nr:uncharacterized protein PSANT_01678 [Moesziomyces antarcticus]